MTPTLWAIALTLFSVGSVVTARIWLQHAEERAAQDYAEGFRRLFPGRCVFCHLHRMAYHHGHERFPEPPPHNCCERNP